MMKTANGLTAIQEIFSFPFHDPKWKNKFLVGGWITLAGMVFPVLPWLALLGYGARIARSAAAEAAVLRNRDNAGAAEAITQPDVAPALLEGESEPAGEDLPPAISAQSTLPEWDNWSELLMDGLRQLGVGALLSLPLLVVMTIGYGIYFTLQMGLALQAERLDPQSLLIMTLVSVGVMFLATGLLMLLGPLTYLFLPAAATQVAVTRRFSDLFRGEWLRVLRRNLGGYLALLFVLAGIYVFYVLAIQLFYVSVVLCCLIPVVAALAGFYVMLLFYHVSGMAYAGGTRS
jgi:hypothetical protein